MIIKTGVVVFHSGAAAWGVGKITEVDALKATIQFSDGVIRKIASSHYTCLQAGDPADFVALEESIPTEKLRAAPKRPKKIKGLVV